MEITIIELITKYGINTVIIASIIFILTGLIKRPIKNLAKKLNDSAKLTRYITFLPIIIGFGITVAYAYSINKQVIFDGNFFTLWLTSSSLSLAIYAFKEKFVPSKSKILSKNELKENVELIEQIKQSVLLEDEKSDKTENIVMQEEPKPQQKIILRGNINNGHATTKEE